MRSVNVLASIVALASCVSAHATWQDLWVGTTDEAATCDRLPPSNNPVTDVTSDDIRCNVNGAIGVSSICTVAAGSNVTVEMHQQPGDRDCSTAAIDPSHKGPVQIYMSKVSDAETNDGSGSWFKIFESGLLDATSQTWATDVLIANCGKQTVTIPANIPAGNYLLRAEVIALHVASSTGGAQFYIGCYQINVTGGTSTASTPTGVSFPGAYSATDPGILINIYYPVPTSYTFPGPAVST